MTAVFVWGTMRILLLLTCALSINNGSYAHKHILCRSVSKPVKDMDAIHPQDFQILCRSVLKPSHSLKKVRQQLVIHGAYAAAAGGSTNCIVDVLYHVIQTVKLVFHLMHAYLCWSLNCRRPRYFYYSMGDPEKS